VSDGRAGERGEEFADIYASLVSALERDEQREAGRRLRELDRQVDAARRSETIDPAYADELQARIEALADELG
jgi:hypothetical protein